MPTETDPYLPREADGGWHRGDWMQTFTGRQFYPLGPSPEDVDPLDISHALGMLCRYNGHVDRFYSVAEHCVLMSRRMPNAQLALEALLHDAAEAYLGDMIRPLKLNMPEYQAAEKAVELAIAQRFGLPVGTYNEQPIYVMPPEVKDADTRILLTERTALMAAKAPAPWVQDGLEPLDVDIRCWDPIEAGNRWLVRFSELVERPDAPEYAKAYALLKARATSSDARSGGES